MYGAEVYNETDVFHEMEFRKVYPLRSDWNAILNEIVKEATSTGSGFAIGPYHIVTNYHVVESAKSIKVRGVNGGFGSSLKAHIVKSDPQSDLAILEIENSVPIGNIPYSLNNELSEVGEDIYVLGYPLTASMGEGIKLLTRRVLYMINLDVCRIKFPSLEGVGVGFIRKISFLESQTMPIWLITTGIISSQTGYRGSISQYQVSAPIQLGNSGSPLLDGNGNLIGVVSSKHLETENVSYVINLAFLKNLLNLMPEIKNSSNSLKGKGLSEQVKQVKNYVYLIEINHD